MTHRIWHPALQGCWEGCPYRGEAWGHPDSRRVVCRLLQPPLFTHNNHTRSNLSYFPSQSVKHFRDSRISESAALASASLTDCRGLTVHTTAQFSHVGWWSQQEMPFARTAPIRWERGGRFWNTQRSYCMVEPGQGRVNCLFRCIVDIALSTSKALEAWINLLDTVNMCKQLHVPQKCLIPWSTVFLIIDHIISVEY